MLDFGLIAKGPGLMRKPVALAIRELSRLARSEGQEVAVDIAFILPGRLGSAERDFEVGPGTRGRTIIYVAVPPGLVRSSEPMPDLIKLAHAGLDFVREHAGSRLDVGAARAALESIAEATHGAKQGSASLTRTSPRPIANRQAAVTSRDSETGVELSLRLSKEVTMEVARALEENLARRLDEEDAGYVDGNEIGGGTYAIFTYGPDPARIRRTVDDVLHELPFTVALRTLP